MSEPKLRAVLLDAQALYRQRSAAIREVLGEIESALAEHEARQAQKPNDWDFAADVAAADITLRQALDCLRSGV